MTPQDQHGHQHHSQWVWSPEAECSQTNQHPRPKYEMTPMSRQWTYTKEADNTYRLQRVAEAEMRAVAKALNESMRN